MGLIHLKHEHIIQHATSNTLPSYTFKAWKCMKPFTFLSLLIPSLKYPSKEIDIYLQPLIDELNEFVNGWYSNVHSFNASFFQLHAALLWTINDFSVMVIYLVGGQKVIMHVWFAMLMQAQWDKRV